MSANLGDTTTEATRRVALGLIERVFNGGDLVTLDEFVAEDLVDHDAPPGVPAGRARLRQIVGAVRAPFQDVRFDVEAGLAEGDRVALHLTWTGTHLGFWAGVPPSRRVRTTGMAFYRIADGRVVERWGITDTPRLLAQLRD